MSSHSNPLLSYGKYEPSYPTDMPLNKKPKPACPSALGSYVFALFMATSSCPYCRSSLSMLEQRERQDTIKLVLESLQDLLKQN